MRLKSAIQTRFWLRLIAWLAPAAILSIPLFADAYALLVEAAFNPRLLQAEGAYPFAMLLILAFFILLKIHELSLKTQSRTGRFNLSAESAAALAAILLSLAIRYSAPACQPALKLLPLPLYYSGWLMLAYPEIVGFILPSLAFYIPASLFLTAAQLFLDELISMGFIQASIPLIGLLGYEAEQQGQLLHLTAASGENLTLYINAACAGVASQSLFMLINGLMYLDLKPPIKYALASTLVGALALFLINIIRLTTIIHIGFLYGVAPMQATHNTFGYVAFIAFYIAYAYLYFRNLKTPIPR